MATIKLTQGKEAIVDDHLYVWLNQWKWSVSIIPKRYAFAVRGDKDGNTIVMHREILRVTLYEDPDVVIHKNRNSLDNRGCNLESCTQSQKSAFNQKTKKIKSSIYKGVSWYKEKGRWRAVIKINYKQIFLGYHDIEEEAARAYDKAAIEYFGEFSWVNFPEESS